MTKESKPSSGNVFADLGFKNADEMLAKAGLAVRITAAMKARKLTQLAAAGILGIDQPKVSNPNYASIVINRVTTVAQRERFT